MWDSDNSRSVLLGPRYTVNTLISVMLPLLLLLLLLLLSGILLAVTELPP